MGYTNDPLVVYTKLSPNHSGQRTHSIDPTIAIRIVASIPSRFISECERLLGSPPNDIK